MKHVISITVLALAACTAAVNADVFLSESDFAPGSWSASPAFSFHDNPNISHDVQTDRFFQDDDPFLIQLFSITSTSQSDTTIIAPVFFDALRYDPSASGAVSSITASVLTIPSMAEPAIGGFGSMRFFIMQDDRLFTLKPSGQDAEEKYADMLEINTLYDQPKTRHATGLVASDFVEVFTTGGGDADSQPNFAGSEMLFGFGHIMSTIDLFDQGMQTFAVGFDNATVRLTTLPAPAAAFTFALLGFTARRRRR